MLITISGLPGSGTSTVARAVATSLGLEHFDGGQVFRALAAEAGLDVHAFGAVAQADPGIDIEIDSRLAVRAKAGGVVLESRLAGWVASNEDLGGLTVWIGCQPDERARRVARRERSTLAAARAQNDAREASEAERYWSSYGIDLADMAPYALLLDSTSSQPDDLVTAIVARAQPT